jgi:hypothetical protein
LLDPCSFLADGDSKFLRNLLNFCQTARCPSQKTVNLSFSLKPTSVLTVQLEDRAARPSVFILRFTVKSLHATKTYGGWRCSSTILNLGTSWSRVNQTRYILNLIRKLLCYVDGTNNFLSN